MWSTSSTSMSEVEHAEHPGVLSGSMRDSRLLTGSQPHRSFWMRRAVAGLSFERAAEVPSTSSDAI